MLELLAGGNGAGKTSFSEAKRRDTFQFAPFRIHGQVNLGSKS